MERWVNVSGNSTATACSYAHQRLQEENRELREAYLQELRANETMRMQLLALSQDLERYKRKVQVRWPFHSMAAETGRRAADMDWRATGPSLRSVARDCFAFSAISGSCSRTGGSGGGTGGTLGLG